jgi:hypothetical protein
MDYSRRYNFPVTPSAARDLLFMALKVPRPFGLGMTPSPR